MIKDGKRRADWMKGIGLKEVMGVAIGCKMKGKIGG